MMKTLLVEIVSEEIPAGYIVPALEAMATLMGEKLSEARIDYGPMKTYATPRRLALVVERVAERQTSVTMEIVGPPSAVAFDSEGRPTKAAEGFAKSQGVAVSRLRTKHTDKGDYVCVKKAERGRAAKGVLQTIIPQVINTIPFPKSMRWGDWDLSFARPIHAIVALLDNQIISFNMEDIKSGRRTLGHRFMHPKPVTIKNALDYVSALRRAFVVADMAERKRLVVSEIEKAAGKLGGTILPDEALVDIVMNLVEYVAVSGGTFDKKFLRVPKEVLITAMREHQKYFAVIDPDKNLRPCFIAVNNTPAKDMKVVTKGHERVLRARLEDARFFFEVDSRTPLSDMTAQLEGVTFQAKLGSMLEKVSRVKALAEHLSQKAAPGLRPAVSRAAHLCKSDLTSQMVNEFPKLQGVMGRIYAGLAGEPESVAQAIEEHYLPTHAGGRLPETLAGSLVSIADKLDSICGCFGIGLMPTGTTDPYALRRQALGIIQIMMAGGLSISLTGLIEKSLDLLADKITEEPQVTAHRILTFFRHRLERLLMERGVAKDLVVSVTSTSIEDIPTVSKRTEALQNLRARPDFEPLAVAFKRVVNIIKQAGERGDLGSEKGVVRADPGIFQEKCEHRLYGELQKVKQGICEEVEEGAFDRALLAVSTLKGPIDDFFDGVMVLVEDEKLKQNRLALLSEIADLFAIFADFSKIST
jgi:glycyl-tRNA synthetase beta chain